MTRTVILDDGTQVKNVPDNVSDEDVFNKMTQQAAADVSTEAPIPVPKEKTLWESTKEIAGAVREASKQDEWSDIGLDFGRVFLSTAAKVAETAPGTTPYEGEDYQFKDRDTGEVVSFEPPKKLNQYLPQVIREPFFTEEGAIKETETVIGATSELVPYVVGSVMAGKTKIAKALPTIASGLFTGVVVDQVLADPEENLFNVLQEIAPESTAAAITDFLAVEEDDLEVTKRVKLLGEGILLGGLIEIVGGVASLAKKSRSKFNKSYTDLTPEERGDILVDHVQEIKNTKSTIDQKPIEFNETPEGVAQVEAQNNSRINRFGRQLFSSRGYWTPQVFHAFEDSENAQRAIVARSEHIAGRLQKELDNISGTLSLEKSKEMADKVQEVLTADLSYMKGQSKEVSIQSLIDDFKLTKEIASEVYDARNLIDEMSKSLVNSTSVPLEFKEVIAENSGSYLRRSYRLFEDAGFTPAAEARQEAREFLFGQIQKNKPDLLMEEVWEEADSYLDKILIDAKGKKEFAAVDNYNQIKKVNKNILQGREEIPAELRAFMGEVLEPSENIVLTISKMAKFSETSRFFENLERMGKQGQYIFDEADTLPTNKTWEKISGTNSTLDGKYTTPEILQSIKDRESFLKIEGDSLVAKVYRNFISAKGYSQKSKTVYSHVTHLRNILGGAQFGLANGLNPFKNGSATFKLLSNEIKSAGQEGLDTLYEKYLRLGIINTNVNVNEFRKLLETGYESGAEELVDKFTTTMRGYGLGAKAAKGAKRIEDFYLATDDFYKINGYLSELDTLKKAFPDADTADLESQAANIIKNTFPNYDRVPKGIKATRQLPFGNFVAFPSEIIRNSFHIISQASKEITSGNATLAARGLKRLTGFTVAAGGWQAMSTQSASMLGLTESEKEGLDIVTETPWSKSAPRIYSKFGDKIYATDTQFLNSYSILSEPLLTAYDEITSGRLRGEELHKYLGTAVYEGIGKVLSPYTDEAILTKSISDVVFALKNESGRTPEGKAIFTEGVSLDDKIVNGVSLVFDSFVPGSVSSIEKLAASFHVNPYTGAERSLETELVANLTGVKATEVNIADRLTYAAKDFVRSKRTILSDSANFGATPEEAVKLYYNRQNAVYRSAQEFFRVLNASRNVIGASETLKTLVLDGTLGEEELGMFTSNKFRPEEISMDDIIRLNKTVNFAKDDQTLASLVKSMQQLYSDMIATPLEKPLSERSPQELMPRLPKAIGGEVYDVPQAPIEPDKRIDKMTGLPYDQQAGGAFVASEDRLTFALGGVAKNIFKAIKAHSKKNVSDEAAEAAANKIVNYFTPEELADPKIQEFAELNTRTLLDEKHDMTIDQMREQGWQGDIGGDEFSIWRGYTRDEIEAFNKANQLADELPFDTQDVTYEITNALDEIQARDIDTPRISVEEEIEADYLERINDALAEGDEDLANELENEMELAVEAFMRDSSAAAPAPTPASTVKVVSKLDKALDKLINRDQPIPVRSFENFLKNEGVSKIEIENSGVLDSIKFLGKNLDDAGGNVPESEILTKGRLTPDTIKTLKETRRDIDQFGVREVEMPDFYDPDMPDADLVKQDFIDIVLPDTNLDTYKVRLYNDPRVMGDSTHFPDEGEFSFHTRTDVEDDAVRILEIQSDQLNSNIDYANILKDGKKLRDKPNKTKEEIKELEEFEAMFGDEYTMPVTDFPYVKRGIYGEIQRAYDEGLNRIEIAVDPSGINDLVRSKEVQKRYETEIPKIAKSVAKDIGAETEMKDGWLVIELPEKEVEIPRYNEGGRIWKSALKSAARRLKSGAYKAGDTLGKKVSSSLGIEKDDIEWANSLGMKYGQREEMDGRGDAARHLALGWLAQRSKKPELSKFLINAREVISNVPEREMDQFNNNLGYAMTARDRAEAEKRITDLVEQQQARYMTPSQSQELHGYALGSIVKAGMKVGKKLANKTDEAISYPKRISNEEYDKDWGTLDEIEDMSEWKNAAKEYVSNNRYSNPSVRTPELEQSAKDFEQGKITRDEQLENVQKYKPVTGWDQLPREPSSKAMVYSLDTNKIENGNFVIAADEAKKLNVGQSSLKKGDKFQGRLDIPAYNSFDTWVVAGTSKDAGKGTHYAKAIHYVGKGGKPVTLNANPNKSLKVAKGDENKSGYAVISGWVKDLDANNIRKTATDLFNNPNWTQVGFDNRRQGKFYVRKANENSRVGDVVTAADEVIQIGPFVFAKNAQIDKAYQGFASGGKVMRACSK